MAFRMDNVGIVVEDLGAAIEFFRELGLEHEGGGVIEGDWAGRVTGLGHQRARECVKLAIQKAAEECGGVHSILIDGIADFVADVMVAVASRALRPASTADPSSRSKTHGGAAASAARHAAQNRVALRLPGSAARTRPVSASRRR